MGQTHRHGTHAVAERSDPRAGDVLGDRYALVRQVDAGGMGAVWEADDLLLGRRVAVKMPIAASLDESDRERVLREARLAARVVHPGVISIFDVGEQDGLPFVVMELVEGPSLARTLQERALSPGEALWIGADLADALDAMHRQGVVHGDVKPANVILSAEGRPKITDLGIASLVEDPGVGGHEADGNGQVDRNGPPTPRYGTRRYVAPEVMGGADTSSRSDAYALGVTVLELADAVDGDSAGAPDRDREAARSALQHTAERATADDPADRPSAGQIASALGSVARVVEPTHRTPGSNGEATALTVPVGLASTTAVLPKGETAALATGTETVRPSSTPGAGGRAKRPRRPFVAALVGLLVAAGLAGVIVAVAAHSGGAPPAKPEPSVRHVVHSPAPSLKPSPAASPAGHVGHGKGHGKDHGHHGHHGDH